MGKVSLRGMRKRHGSVDVIKGVDLEVNAGQCVALAPHAAWALQFGADGRLIG